MKPCEKEFYTAVTEFVINYAMSRAGNERFILATPQRQMSSSMVATLRAWQQKRDNIDEVIAAGREASEDTSVGPLTREIIEAHTTSATSMNLKGTTPSTTACEKR